MSVQSEELIQAAFQGDLERVEYLVEHGADIDAPGSEHHLWNPFHTAIENEQVAVVSYLLRAGANPNAVIDGFSPLHHAVEVQMDGFHQTQATEYPDATLVALLVEAGATINVPHEGYSALDLAEGYHHRHAAEYLRSKAEKNLRMKPPGQRA